MPEMPARLLCLNQFCRALLYTMFSTVAGFRVHRPVFFFDRVEFLPDFGQLVAEGGIGQHGPGHRQAEHAAGNDVAGIVDTADHAIPADLAPPLQECRPLLGANSANKAPYSIPGFRARSDSSGR